jgi:hypothetical protein
MSGRAEPETMRWCEHGCDEPEVHAYYPDDDAWTVVTWMRHAGGKARYEPAHRAQNVLSGSQHEVGPRIVITGPNDSRVIARPGDTIMKGRGWFTNDPEGIDELTREFTVSSVEATPEPESMTWNPAAWDEPGNHTADIFEWMNDLCGEAIYDHLNGCIAVRTANGWVNAKPGDRIVATDEWFEIASSPGETEPCRVFTVSSPEATT